RVPAGAVALAGPYSAVYPRATPGGWQLIGTMPDPRPLWDPARERAALLTPGTRVRFVTADDVTTTGAPGDGATATGAPGDDVTATGVPAEGAMTGDGNAAGTSPEAGA
ncbi:carboxyltransferase domain-containing protein, partial [Streptomyces sp. SID6013]|nr:carboxyltransferase domain-containing protein [Streptomyces sp. SID6013]